MRNALLLLAAAAWIGGCGGGVGLPVDQGPEWTNVEVMTRNVYYGADLSDAIVAVVIEDPVAIVEAVSAVWADLEATDFQARARALALEIHAAQPDLIGIQEAALWRTQYPSDAFTASPTPAEDVAYDFLAILLEELAAVGLHYEVAVELATIDAEFPRAVGPEDLEDVRFTDREAILVRRREHLSFENPQAAWFDAIAVLPGGLPIPQGWVSVDVTHGEDTFRFVSTHLEADFQDLRVAQAAELVAGPTDTDLPVVLVGDFNSDARPGNIDSPAFDTLVAAGFDRTAPHPRIEGTCCQEDVQGEADPGAHDEQIDLILVRDGEGIAFYPSDWQVIGPTLAETPSTLWSSDHAGACTKLWWRP